MGERAIMNNNSTLPLVSLLDIGIITTIVGAFLYISGWSYASNYFSSFNLGMLGIEIEREYLLLYGFWVARDYFLIVILCLFVIVLLYIFLQYIYRHSGAREASYNKIFIDTKAPKRILVGVIKVGFYITIPTIIFSLFIISYWLGDIAGQRSFEMQYEDDFPSYPRVKVWLARGKDDQSNQREQEWAKGCYRLLMRDKNNIYIFPTDGQSKQIPLEVIPQKKVETIRLLNLYQTTAECQ